MSADLAQGLTFRLINTLSGCALDENGKAFHAYKQLLSLMLTRKQ